MTLLGAQHAGKPATPHALVLAAGLGSRFGGGKLHSLYRGETLLSHVLAVVKAACARGQLAGGYVVVAGDDERALGLVRAAGLHPVVNDSPGAGLSRSLRLGLEALENAGQAVAAMVFLADQPRVNLEVVERLVSAWSSGTVSIIRPRYAARPDVPGHPVLIPSSLWHGARLLQGDQGFSALPASITRETVVIDVPGNNPDVDTVVDLQRLEEHSP